MGHIKTTALESEVKNEVKKVLKYYEPECYWFMPPANGFGRHGIPDFVGCICGKFFAIETKRPSNRDGVTALQRREQDKINDAKGSCFVVYDDDSLAILQSYLFNMRMKYLTHELEV